MSNEVTFTIKILSEGGDGIKKVTADASELGAAIDHVTDKSSRMNGKLLDINQSSQAIMNVATSMQQIVGQVKELTEAWEKQEDAELKLETVMKQRTNASDADIASIKNLAKEQQKLGVVGDEVQLAGAQQIATFVNQKQSIEQLIPAMNNLLVQRYGLNTTQEQAVEIGNLMGKAMQGQTTMLQRVGITFTETQAKVIKYGNEQQRAAMLAQVITDNVGQMNEKFAQTDLGKAKQLSNNLGDVKEQIGQMLTPLAPLLTGMSQLGMSVLEIMRLRQGISGLAAAFSLAQIKAFALGIQTKIQSAAAATSAALNKLLGISLYGEAAAAGTATVATKAFQTAITLGLAAALTAIGVLISKLVTWIVDLCGSEDDATKETDKLNESAERTKATEEEYKQKLQETRSELQIYITKLKDFHGTKDQEKKIVEELNGKYGETLGYFSSVSGWYKALTADSEAYCQQLVMEARQRMLANQIAQKDQETHDLIYNSDGSKKGYSDTHETKKVQTGTEYVTTGQVTVAVGKYTDEKEASALDKVNAKIRRNNADVKSLKEQMVSVGKAAANIKMPVMGSLTPPSGGNGKSGTGKNGDDTPKLIENAKTYAELGNNIEFYEGKLEKTKPTEEATISLYARKIAALKSQQEQIKLTETAATVKSNPEEIKTIEEADAAISYQQQLRKKATEAEIVGIDKTITALNRRKTAIEESGKSDAFNNELNTYSEIDAEVSRLTTKMQTSNTTERSQINQTIETYRRKREAMEEADAIVPEEIGKLNTMKALDAAIQYYTQLQQRQSIEEITATQTTIDALQKKRQLLTDLASISTQGIELGDLKALTGKELTIRLKEIGIEGIETKIRGLQKMLENTNIGSNQQKEIKSQITSWSNYEKQLKKSQVTLRGSWEAIRGVGFGIQSLTKIAKQGGTAWDKFSGVVDASFQIYESVSEIIKIVNALTAASVATESAASAAKEAVNATEQVTWLALMAAKVTAKYAAIPGGPALAAGEIATFKAQVVAASVPTFANGAMLYGATLGLMGEYPGANRNPEVIAPLDKLQGIISNSIGGTGGKIELKVKGRNLEGVLRKRRQLESRN